jgi:phosphate transport system substrate-binding protein
VSAVYLQDKGSDTMVNLALAWSEAYSQAHSNFQISVTGGGSGTGIAALLNGTTDIANASREIKPEEVKQAEATGFTPVATVVAKDAIAIVVNKQNPIEHLTLAQLSAIYKGEITNWSQLVSGYDHPIVALSRESNSGTHVYFLESVVRLGNSSDKSIFAPTVLLLPSSEGIIAEVRDNPNAIGYDGLGYITDEVKKVAVAKDENSLFVIPEAATVIAGEYPISRDLFMYTRGEPSGAIKEYLDWILSTQGQSIVADLGFIPITSGGQ